MRNKTLIWSVVAVAAIAMLAATHFRWWPLGFVEVLGFVTGAVCVLLVVQENAWNWPIGLANNVVFLALFWQARLYADSLLQVVYFVLGLWGWWNWLHGGPRHDRLPISRTPLREWLILLAAIPLVTWGMNAALVHYQGAAPLWDALTTTLSLAAQVQLTRKRLEHWFIWIVADLIYVPLYVSRDLPLTALLYAVFLGLCVAGIVEWRRRLAAQTEQAGS